MDINKINGTQLCENCTHWRKHSSGKRAGCIHAKAKKCWFANQRNGCDYFDGELVQIDWNKATPIGYRPSTFSKRD